ncbi:tyrosine-type recombinase/integrase [Streptomyces filamentosus]|uniref:tyrosine-type recombinase/integrase n=1 Tax=Streptomyces filamentosus TaxID=67294 RepID=UPI0037D3EA7A
MRNDVKTRHSYRTVSVPRSVISALTEHLKDRSAAPDSFVFPAPGGNPMVPMSREQFYKVAWRPAVKAAELPAGTRLHDLRHTYASALIAAGKDPKTVAIRLGDTVGVTMSTYAHLFPEEDEDTRVVVGDFLVRALNVPSGAGAPSSP